MAKYTGSVCRLCRREGQKLYLKGERCTSNKCSFEKRPLPPGQQSKQNKRKANKISEYGQQLREKQKVKRYYGLLEKQFRKYFDLAEKMNGITGENLLILLERRLDNVVYRLGLARSRKEARQIINHKHITVNGKVVAFPSFIVREGDVIEVKPSHKRKGIFEEIKEENDTNATVPWLNVDLENLKGTVVSLPKREDIDLDISEHFIVELYSK